MLYLLKRLLIKRHVDGKNIRKHKNVIWTWTVVAIAGRSSHWNKEALFMGKIIGKIVTVTVDRPLGSFHPEYKDLYYPVNYGYIQGIFAADGEEQDAYILGINQAVREFTGKVIAVIHRNDDVEEKWVVCPKDASYSEKEIWDMVWFQEQYYDSEIRID